VEIDLSRLAAADLPVRGEVRLPEDTAGSAGRALSSEGIRFPEALRIDAVARREGERLVVRGHVEGRAELDCGRCLRAFAHPLALDFVARFAPERAVPRATQEDGEDGIEVEADDLDLSFLPEGTTALSITELVREQVLLELPFRPLCREDCAGLCPRCGSDRNAEACRCSEEEPGQPRDLRLAPLLDLKRKLKN
jgi:uncharacterized protein